MLVYLVTNRINGHKYVGQTRQSLARRWQGHCHDAQRGKTTALASAIRKHGKDAFTVEIVGTYHSQAELNAAEQAAICALNAHKWDGGYNLTFGGEAPAWSNEQREAQSARKKGKTHKGGKWSAESRKKASEQRKGRNFAGPIIEHTCPPPCSKPFRASARTKWCSNACKCRNANRNRKSNA